MLWLAVHDLYKVIRCGMHDIGEIKYLPYLQIQFWVAKGW